MSSPYKKMKTTNQGWIGYLNIGKLDAHKAYTILGIMSTNHPQYGPGHQATIIGHNGRKWRTQLPGKYLANLTAVDIDDMKRDIVGGKNCFLIYRETMPDNSYRIDIVEHSDEIVSQFTMNETINELEDSVVEDDIVSESNKKDDATNGNDKETDDVKNDGGSV